jgi:hypothetical protein
MASSLSGTRVGVGRATSFQFVAYDLATLTKRREGHVCVSTEQVQCLCRTRRVDVIPFQPGTKVTVFETGANEFVVCRRCPVASE